MRQKSNPRPYTQADIIIVGGNHSGLSLAALLGIAGFNVLCLERSSRKATKPTAGLLQDGRTVALSFRSVQLLRQAKVWPLIKAKACPIKSIRIADQQSPATLDFDYREVSDEPFGWIVENKIFIDALTATLAKLKNVRLIRGANVVTLENNDAMATVSLSDGSRYRAPLVIGADGRKSLCRSLAKIETYGWDYSQMALICNIAHSEPHRNIAVEHFLPGGPLAVLPMTDAAQPHLGVTHRSSIVWTDSVAAINTLMSLNVADFTEALQEKTAAWLGDIKLINQRQSYPLQLQHAKTYIAPRLALIGDAAHGIHPIAGQGFNLGMGDIEVLVEELTQAARLGLDLGNTNLLKRYEKRRKFDNGNMVLATDLLDRLFSNALPPVQAIRRLGLGMVQRLPRLKKFFMRTAMGLNNARNAA